MSESDLKPNETTSPSDEPQAQAPREEGAASEPPKAGEAYESLPDEPQDELQEDQRDAQIQALAAENQKLIYQLAEMQNIVRRIRNQAEQDKKYAAESLASSLLPVLDGFERTFAAAAKGASVESLADGVRVIDKQLRKALEAVGVQRIISLGAPFDPEKHEALDTVDNAELDDETVVDEIEAGYQLQDRIIRHAKVRVSRRP